MTVSNKMCSVHAVESSSAINKNKEQIPVITWLKLGNILLYMRPHFVLSYLLEPRGLSGKESACQCWKHRFDPWIRKIP